MIGVLRLMLVFALLIGAIYAMVWLWTGSLPAYGAEVLGTLGILTAVSLAIILLSKPAGGSPKN